MKRTIAPFLALLVSGLLGCEPLSGTSLRRNHDETTKTTTTEKPSDVDSSVLKNEHSASGSRGTWSKEAQEIEGHFNVR